ncbi:MAG: DNA polymerase III subunit [Elusimicrobiales bacterium]|nr:DNA polymerase III subunit [Elusimicrobiales bacterium]
MSFSSILGQDKTIKRLRALIESGRVPPAIIFHGAPGIGKFLTAVEFAKALNCSHTEHRERPPAPPAPDENDLFAAAATGPAPEPELPPAKIHSDPSDSCGTCLSCLQAASGAHPDIRIVDTAFQAALLDETESANLKIDTMRELTRWAQQKPMLSGWKVFIVRDAEAMMPPAQNALLKTLEEPPPGTVVILTVSKKNSLLSTIISRSCLVEFGRLPAPALKTILEAQGAEPAQAAALAALGSGSLEKAADAAAFLKQVSALRPGDQSKVFKFAAGLPRDSHKAREEVKTLLDLLLAKTRSSWTAASGPAKTKFTALLRRTLDLRRMADRNVSYYLLLETALLESERAGIKIEDLVKP